MQFTKYVIETNEKKYISINEHKKGILWISMKGSPYSESCWFDSIEEASELLEAMTYTHKEFKNRTISGYSIHAVKPVTIKKLSLMMDLENI